MELVIEAEFASDLHKYLSTRPYNEVGGLCRYIEAKMSEAVEAQKLQASIEGVEKTSKGNEAPRGLVRANQAQPKRQSRRKRR